MIFLISFTHMNCLENRKRGWKRGSFTKLTRAFLKYHQNNYQMATTLKRRFLSTNSVKCYSMLIFYISIRASELFFCACVCVFFILLTESLIKFRFQYLNQYQISIYVQVSLSPTFSQPYFLSALLSYHIIDIFKIRNVANT